MRTSIRAAVVTITITATSLLGSTAFAAGPDRIGPFEQWSACEHEGNAGMDDGRWKDYTCDGVVPQIWLYPQY
jgi:hypothetical protein